MAGTVVIAATAFLFTLLTLTSTMSTNRHRSRGGWDD